MPRLPIAICLVLFSVLVAAAQERQLVPLPVQDAIAARTFSTTPFSLSNDGYWIAYTLQDPKRSQIISDERQRWLTASGTPPQQIGCDVWITNVKTRETRNLTEGKGNSWSPVWSPDNNYLAFFSDRGGLATLWIWERRSETLRQVSDLPVVGYRGLSFPRWTADSKSIVFCVLPEGMTVEKAALRFTGLENNRPAPNTNKLDQPTVTVFKSTAVTNGSVPLKTTSSTSVYNDAYAADLVIVQLEGAKVRRLVKGSKPCTYWPSPDGAYIAFTNLKENSGQPRFDLMAISVRDNVPITLAANLNQGFVALSVSWSTNGILSYTTLESQPGGQLRRECYLVAPNSTPRRVTGTPVKGFSSPLRAPLWDKSGQFFYLISGNSLWRVTATSATAVEVARMRDRNIVDIVPSTVPGRFWSPDEDGSLFVTTSDPESLRVGFSRINLTSGEVTPLVEEDKVYGAGNPLLPAAMGTPDGRWLLYIAEDTGHNPDFWAFDGNVREAQRVTNTNPEFDKYVMGASTLVEWRGPGGERLRGALLLPAGYQKGKRYPLVVSLYPDEELSRHLNLFGMKFNIAIDSVNNQQLLATRGYAVLLADSRMSVGNPMQEIVRSVMPGVNRVIEMGIADPNRMGIIGHSHGGYAVLSIVSQVQRFKAAVSWAGSANLITMYGQMDSDGTSHWIDWAETGLGNIGGSLWQVRERYIENSPIFYLDQVNTPLLIVQGTSDRITTPNHSEEIFVGLRRLNKEAEYARYEGEDHGFWFYPNRVDYCNRLISWFDRWLKPTETEISKTPQ